MAESKQIKFEVQPGPQEIFQSSNADIAIFGGARGGGKQVRTSETMLAWGGKAGSTRRADAVMVGDYLVGSDGTPKRVLSKSDPEVLPFYRVKFDDGSSLDVSGNHIWTVFDLSQRGAGQKERGWCKADITTEELIRRGLRYRTQSRFAIPLMEPMEPINPEKPTLPPYTLGYWLGNGCKQGSTLTCHEDDVLEIDAMVAIDSGLETETRQYDPDTKRAKILLTGWRTLLRRAGWPSETVEATAKNYWVFTRDKICVEWRYWSAAHRRSLLAGLLDSDGTCNRQGEVEFDSSSPDLALLVRGLFQSLGMKPNRTRMRISKRANEKPMFRVKCAVNQQVFRLARKAVRVKTEHALKTARRYIVEVEPIGLEEGVCFSVDSEDHLYVAGAEYILTHNSYGLLLEPMRHVKKPRFTGVIFRRTYPQINQEGGLWDTSELIYPYAGARGSRSGATWVFPSGATVSFNHMETEADRHNWLGAQIPFIGFDQIETFKASQFWDMLACNRDPSGTVRPYIRATCNPEPDSWLSRLVQWWWDETTGYAIAERSGVVRWFARVGDALKWADSSGALKAIYPYCVPKSLTFIPSKVQDNKILLERDPSYLGSLMALPLVDRERYLNGNWKIKAGTSMMFRREWFGEPVQADAQIRFWCRYWDLAATTEEEAEDPDWTAGALLGFWGGVWYLRHMIRFRGTPKENEDIIRQTAATDPRGTMTRMEREGGASGKSLVDHYRRNVLVGRDYDGWPALGDKVTRAGPFSSAAQAGNFKLVSGLWITDFLDECEAFRGEDEHNDQVDAVTGAMAVLTDKLQNSSGGVSHKRAVEQADREVGYGSNRRIML